MPPSKGAVEDRLQAIKGVESASLEAACCEDGKVILYIGIHEEGGPPLAFRDYPTESPDMPEAISKAYSQFLDRVQEAGKAGEGSEDLTAGHSLMANPGGTSGADGFYPAGRYSCR